MATILESLQNQQHRLLQPTEDLSASILDLAKQYLDCVAADTRSVNKERQDSKKKLRKTLTDDRLRELFRIHPLYTKDFQVDQVWQQAKRVLDASKAIARQCVPVEGNESDQRPAKKRRVLETEAGGTDEIDLHQPVEIDQETDHSLNDESSDYSSVEEKRSDYRGANKTHNLEDGGSSANAEDDASFSEVSNDETFREELVKDKYGLNDGFFSIDKFNQNTQFLESVDARGDTDDGAASDEEDIDWEADPLTDGAHFRLGKSKPQNVDEGGKSGSDDDEDNGPTFADTDLDAPDTDGDENGSISVGEDAMADFSNTNEIMYADFFAPPAGSRSKKHQLRKTTRRRDRSDHEPEQQPEELAKEDDYSGSESEADVQRAMSSVRRDFEDDKDEIEAEVESMPSDRNPNQNLSTHERRMAAFRKEIARLERENVAKKPWALTGETVAPARPENALLEEDMEFERAGKPLPVNTQEMSESIEDLVKRRVLNSEFDEILRRRPEVEDVGKMCRRGLIEAKSHGDDIEAKPQKGLAEEYEDEHLRKTDPNFVDQRSETLKKKHVEIEKQWTGLQAQLDALCNWHYKPRPLEKNVEIRSDVPVVRMEEARPTADVSGNLSGLAPQEVYRPGEGSHSRDEVRTPGGTAVSREEETRESKRRRRRRLKERLRRARGNLNLGGENNNGEIQSQKTNSKQKDRDEIAETLRSGNVKLIGRKGEVQSIKGSATSAARQDKKIGAAALML